MPRVTGLDPSEIIDEETDAAGDPVYIDACGIVRLPILYCDIGVLRYRPVFQAMTDPSINGWLKPGAKDGSSQHCLSLISPRLLFGICCHHVMYNSAGGI
jgi:hypothetical protein